MVYFATQASKRELFHRVFVVWLSIAILSGATSCTRSINVPERSLTHSTSYEGLYRIETRTTDFTVREFSVIDSTLVITRLGGSDKQFGTENLPIIVNLSDVSSISKLEASVIRTALAVVGVLAVAAVLIVATSDFTLTSQ